MAAFDQMGVRLKAAKSSRAAALSRSVTELRSSVAGRFSCRTNSASALSVSSCGDMRVVDVAKAIMA